MSGATKLICTIGPGSAHAVAELVQAGMDIARVNFSHGRDVERRRVFERVRQAERSSGRPVGVLADLCGPKLRLGQLAGGWIELKEGDPFLLVSRNGRGDARSAPANYSRLAQELRRGDSVLLADGAVELRVIDCDEGVLTEVVRGGEVRSRSGLNVPSHRLSLPAVTRKDRIDLRRAIELGADFVAQSFVRRAADVRQLRRLIGDHAIRVVAKVETRGAVEDADGILEEADALMVARGDLGVELPFEDVPLIQKDLVHRAIVAGRPAIVATHMLRSMTGSPRPTRAEASDVANAVLDGAQGILLSEETAIGRYPLEAARAASRIIGAAEQRLHGVRAPEQPALDVLGPEPSPPPRPAWALRAGA